MPECSPRTFFWREPPFFLTAALCVSETFQTALAALYPCPLSQGLGEELRGQFLSMYLQTAWLPRIPLKIAHSLTMVPNTAWDSARIHPTLATFFAVVALSASILLATQTGCLLVQLGLKKHVPDGNTHLTAAMMSRQHSKTVSQSTYFPTLHIW